MEKIEENNSRISISFEVIRYITLYYFSIAVLLTIIQIIMEYNDIRQNISSSIQEITSSFNESLTNSLWEFNDTQTHTILTGILESPSVMGVRLVGIDGRTIVQLGQTIEEDYKPIDNIFLKYVSPQRLFSFEKVLSKNLNGSGQEVIGSLYIYSGNKIILDQLSRIIFYILINSILVYSKIRGKIKEQKMLKVLAIALLSANLSVSAAENSKSLQGSALLKFSIFKITIYKIDYHIYSKEEDAQKEALILTYQTDVAKSYSLKGWQAGIAPNISSPKKFKKQLDWINNNTPDFKENDVFKIEKINNKVVSFYKNNKLLAKKEDAKLAKIVFSPWLGEKPIDDEIKQNLLAKKTKD